MKMKEVFVIYTNIELYEAVTRKKKVSETSDTYIKLEKNASRISQIISKTLSVSKSLEIPLFCFPAS